MAKQKDPNAKKFPFGKFMAWKSSDIASAWVSWIVNTYILFYCTDTLGIDSVTAGTILLVTNVFDAITDFLIGFVIDSSKVTKWGKVRPYELTIVGVTICTAIMFMCPGEAPMWLKIVWVSLMYSLAFGVFNTAKFGAQTPYLIRAFDNDRGLIGKVCSYGGLVTTMGAAVVTMLFPKLMGVFAFSQDVSGDSVVYHLNAEGWTKLMLIVMIPATLIALFRFIFVKENPEIDTGKEAVPFSFKQVWKMLITNKYIWGYALMIFAFNMVQNFGATAYYFNYVVGDSGSLGTISIMSYFMLPLMLLFPVILKKFNASKLIGVTTILSIIGYVINFFAGSNMILLIIGSILTAFVALPISYLGGLLLMQICNYNEYKGISRQEATTTAVASGLASQLGQGFAPYVTGWVLKLSGYVEGTGVVQSESAVMGIRLLYSVIPGICIVLIIFGVLILNKLEMFSPQMEKELAARRAGESVEKKYD